MLEWLIEGSGVGKASIHSLHFGSIPTVQWRIEGSGSPKGSHEIGHARSIPSIQIGIEAFGTKKGSFHRHHIPHIPVTQIAIEFVCMPKHKVQVGGGPHVPQFNVFIEVDLLGKQVTKILNATDIPLSHGISVLLRESLVTALVTQIVRYGLLKFTGGFKRRSLALDTHPTVVLGMEVFDNRTATANAHRGEFFAVEVTQIHSIVAPTTKRFRTTTKIFLGGTEVGLGRRQRQE